MKTIQYTDNELSVLVQLLDIAVKAQGLNVAEAAIALTKKIQMASAPTDEVVEPFFAEPALVPDEADSDENSEENSED